MALRLLLDTVRWSDRRLARRLEPSIHLKSPCRDHHRARSEPRQQVMLRDVVKVFDQLNANDPNKGIVDRGHQDRGALADVEEYVPPSSGVLGGALRSRRQFISVL